jgi:hypothetical protein
MRAFFDEIVTWYFIVLTPFQVLPGFVMLVDLVFPGISTLAKRGGHYLRAYPLIVGKELSSMFIYCQKDHHGNNKSRYDISNNKP